MKSATKPRISIAEPLISVSPFELPEVRETNCEVFGNGWEARHNAEIWLAEPNGTYE
jgi:hypothetical protein